MNSQITSPGDPDSLLRDFCQARGVEKMPESRNKALLADVLFKGYCEFYLRTLEHMSEFDTLPLEDGHTAISTAIEAQATVAPNAVEAIPLSDVVSRYFEELERTNALVAKTQSEKEDALALMAELTGAKPLADMTKADAQKVKAALFKLPKNRRKTQRQEICR